MKVNKKASVITLIMAALLVMPMVAWAGGGGGPFSAGYFALVIEVGFILALIGGSTLLEKVGIKVPKLIQFPILYASAYVLLRVVLSPPIPFSLLAMYMGVFTIGALLYCSCTVDSWNSYPGAGPLYD